VRRGRRDAAAGEAARPLALCPPAAPQRAPALGHTLHDHVAVGSGVWAAVLAAGISPAGGAWPPPEKLGQGGTWRPAGPGAQSCEQGAGVLRLPRVGLRGAALHTALGPRRGRDRLHAADHAGAWGTAPRRRDGRPSPAARHRGGLGGHAPRSSGVHVQAGARGQCPPRPAHGLPRRARLGLLRAGRGPRVCAAAGPEPSHARLPAGPPAHPRGRGTPTPRRRLWPRMAGQRRAQRLRGAATTAPGQAAACGGGVLPPGLGPPLPRGGCCRLSATPAARSGPALHVRAARWGALEEPHRRTGGAAMRLLPRERGRLLLGARVAAGPGGLASRRHLYGQEPQRFPGPPRARDGQRRLQDGEGAAPRPAAACAHPRCRAVRPSARGS
jgi:hypothetical protein